MALRARLLGGSPVATSNATGVLQSPSFNFLSLPLDLRLEIYNCLTNDSHPAHPWESPLYSFLYVSRQVRHEIGQLFYRAPGLVFPNPPRCLSFLEFTAPHVYLLTSLAISVPDGEMYGVEPIFQKLVEAGAPLTTLVLDLRCHSLKESRAGGWGTVVEEVGAVGLNKAREHAQELEKLYEKHRRQNTPFPESSSLGENPSGSWLGKLKTVRYLSIEGNPFGNWKTEFELGVLTLHARMFDIAKIEGQMTLQRPAWYGSWGDWYWFGSAELAKRGSLPESISSLISASMG
ncbi:hypothetical protein BDZ45DRAFT_669963 [Acephala macrosclerotiorum]|nr:hypothetical protein BDZ45DRAFT_669963 [Acephala macrosclerotiorum]